MRYASSLPWVKSGYLLYDEVTIRFRQRFILRKKSTICSPPSSGTASKFTKTRLRQKPRAPWKFPRRAGDHDVVVKDDAHSDEGSSDLDLTPGSLGKNKRSRAHVFARDGHVPLLTAKAKSYRQAHRARAARGDESITRSPIVIKELIAVGDRVAQWACGPSKKSFSSTTKSSPKRIANKTQANAQYIDKMRNCTRPR